MWFLPLLVIGVVAIAAASRSAREAPPMLLAPPQLHVAAPVPGPISVLGEFARIGQAPPPFVILCAIAEAESIGRNDLASDIMRVFVAPIVYQHELARARVVPASASPGRGTYAPATHERGSCALPAAAPREAVREHAQRQFATAAQPALAPRRFATDDEIRAMLDADPRRFFEMATAARGAPVIEVPVEVVRQAAVPVATAQATPPAAEAGVLTEQLLRQPGHVGAGIVQDPSTGAEIFEVRWLRDHPLPPLPQAIGGRAVRLVIVDALPVAHVETLPASFAEAIPAAHAEALAQATEAQAPGSPIDGVSDDAWRQFVHRLERESPQFSSSRHVGQYRQCRDRLAELGIDPSTIHGSTQAQRSALDVDLADAQQRLAETGDLQRHCGRRIAVPGLDEAQIATLSGILGVVQCAGLDNAIGWLERQGDRKRFPHTTQVFLRTNGVF